MNPLYFFAVWDSKMAAVTKNSAEHENDNISIIVQQASCLEGAQCCEYGPYTCMLMMMMMMMMMMNRLMDFDQICVRMIFA